MFILVLEGVRSKCINYILSFPKAGESRTEEVGEQDLVSVSNSVTSKDLCDNLSDCLADQKVASENRTKLSVFKMNEKNAEGIFHRKAHAESVFFRHVFDHLAVVLKFLFKVCGRSSCHTPVRKLCFLSRSWFTFRRSNRCVSNLSHKFLILNFSK